MKMEIARKLIEIGAVKFSPQIPFTYASGSRGPVYCDNRLLLSHVSFRNLIIENFIKVIHDNKLSFDLIGGIATAGIPHASFVADRMQKPMIYVRPKAKGHGRMNQVEGDISASQKVLLFEDLVNQGSSLVEAMNGLKNAELQCGECLCIVNYEMKSAQKNLSDLSIRLFSLTDFTSLSLAAFELKLINQDDLTLLQNWHSDPDNWCDKD